MVVDAWVNLQTLSVIDPYFANQAAYSANYVQQCYSNSTRVLDCNGFFTKWLAASRVVTNASCPFGGGICRSNTSNLVLDSGYIDSHVRLGLTTPPDSRVQLRTVLS